MLGPIVYLLCALTSTLCAVMLFLKFRSSGARLLLWNSLGFAGLAINNILLFIDLVIMPDLDLSTYRLIPGFVGLGFMIWGFVWDTI